MILTLNINRDFLLLCYLTCLAISQQANWQLIYSQFHQWSITDCDGWIQSNGQPVFVNKCNHNGMDIICLDGDHQLSQKQLNSLPPHFEIQFYGDVYLLDSWDTETGFVMLDGITQFTVTFFFSSFPHFQNQCGAFWGNYVKITTVNQIMQHISNSVQIIIGTNLDELFSNESFNFRNIQLWVRLCHKTCETCNGDSEANCLTCFQGIPNLGVCSSCDNQNTQYFQNYTGCVQECDRHTQADDSLNCIVNSSNLSIYQLEIQVSTDYNWQVMNEFGSITSRQITCNGLIIDGIFNSNEWMEKDILISPTTTKLRIRVTFYMFYPQQWEQFSQIEFSMNGQMINLVYNDFGQVKPIKSKVIYSISGTCIENLEDFQIIRTEQTIGVIQAASNVHFKIKAKQNWGVKDIYIDEISCSLNCDVCLDENNCASCQSGYYVHHKQCVSDCPLHSDKDDVNYQCIDFDEETEKTSYLLKAFYLESSPPQEATVYFDLISQTGFNFMKGVQFSYLRNKRIFGGAITWHNAVFSKAYTIIPPHYGIRVRMQVILGDDFANGQFSYQINGGIVHSIYSTTPFSDKHQEWGDVFDEQFYQINEYISHTGSQLTVQVECISDPVKAVNESFCGIADYFITILECPLFCNSCSSWVSCNSWDSQSFLDPITHNCISGYNVNQYTLQCEINSKYCGNGIIEENEECDDINNNPFDGCQNCLYICQPIFPDCVIYHPKLCPLGYSLNIFDNQCSPICGDNIIVSDEDCDDGNLIPFDGCHLCHYQCQESCLKCDFGLCSLCQNGWLLQEQTGQCLSNCGDGIVNGQETCEDFNDSSFDGCFECQFQCEEQCTSCLYGICYECNTLGFYISDNHCFTKCGDSLVRGIEECDDGNIIPYDGCFECHFQCQQSCLDCIETLCYLCEPAWALIDHWCQPICGDQIVLPEYEECDDGNIIPYDGCYDCSYQCQPQCTDCRLGICYECDTIGWELTSRRLCSPVCGDGLVIDFEECDDPENLGCQNCKFACHEKCLDCIQGICYKCTSGWYVRESQCYSICGDGYKVDQEECDDYNLYDLDGCSSKCEIEANWMCDIVNHQSFCNFKVDPKFVLKYLDNQSETQYVTIGFTNAMKKKCDFDFNMQLDGCEDNQYTFVTTPIAQAKFNTLLMVEQLVEIHFNKNCIRPKFKIYLSDNKCLVNYYEQELNPPFDHVLLNQINIISKVNEQKVTNLELFSQYIFYSFLGLFALSLMTGSLDLMWNMLDLLQYFSYLQFINVPFPKNLDLYFEIFGTVSMQPLLEKIQIESLQKLLTGGVGLPFVECHYKFSELNGLFIENAQSYVVVLLFSYLMYFVQRMIFNVLRKVSFKQIITLKLRQANIFLFIRKLLQRSIKSFYSSQHLRIYLSSVYDINFSIFIQLATFTCSTAFLAFNSILSLTILLIYFIILYQLFQSKAYKFSLLIEGIKPTSLWSREYNCVQLLKKTIFMFLLIFLSVEPIFQSLIISFLCLLNICFIYITKPLINIHEYYKVMLGESVFAFCSFTFILYEINVSLNQIYSDNMYQIFGWIHIGLISGVLCICLIIDVKQQIQMLIHQYRQYILKNRKKQVPQNQILLY